MARCPNCRKHFRTLPDEEGMHDCPACGFGPDDECESGRCPECGGFLGDFGCVTVGCEPPDDDEPDNDEPPRACGWCGVTFTESGDCGCCADDYEHDDERQHFTR